MRCLLDTGVLLRMFDASDAEWKRLAVAHRVVGKAAHDARLVAQMLISQISVVLTLNTGDFRRYRGITALTPKEFLQRIAAP